MNKNYLYGLQVDIIRLLLLNFFSFGKRMKSLGKSNCHSIFNIFHPRFRISDEIDISHAINSCRIMHLYHAIMQNLSTKIWGQNMTSLCLNMIYYIILIKHDTLRNFVQRRIAYFLFKHDTLHHAFQKHAICILLFTSNQTNYINKSKLYYITKLSQKYIKQ